MAHSATAAWWFTCVRKWCCVWAGSGETHEKDEGDEEVHVYSVEGVVGWGVRFVGRAEGDGAGGVLVSVELVGRAGVRTIAIAMQDLQC